MSAFNKGFIKRAQEHGYTEKQANDFLMKLLGGAPDPNVPQGIWGNVKDQIGLATGGQGYQQSQIGRMQPETILNQYHQFHGANIPFQNQAPGLRPAPQVQGLAGH